MEEIHTETADLMFGEINGIAPSFYLVLSEAYSEPTHRYQMDDFAKIVNGQIPLIAFAQKLRLRCLTGF